MYKGVDDTTHQWYNVAVAHIAFRKFNAPTVQCGFAQIAHARQRLSKLSLLSLTRNCPYVYRDIKWLFYIQVSRIVCVVDRLLLFDGSQYTSFGYGVSFFVLIKDKMQDVPVCHDERIDLSIGRNKTIFFAREDVIGVIFVDKSMFFYFFYEIFIKKFGC